MRQGPIFRTWGKAHDGIEVSRRKLYSHPIPKSVGFQINHAYNWLLFTVAKLKWDRKNEHQRDTRTCCDGSSYRGCPKIYGSFVAGDPDARISRFHYELTINGAAIAAPFFVISEA